MIYPDHIYDPIRNQIAVQLLEKELAKLFPDIPNTQLGDSVNSWRDNATAFHLEDNVRDFWNIFAAIMESIKLKPKFTAFITAENYHWRQEVIDVGPIKLSSNLDQLNEIPGFIWTDQTTVDNVLKLIVTTEILNEQKRINDLHSRDSQDKYPIIVRKLPDSSHQVMDGNRRSLRAGLYGRQTINAWVAHMDTETPKDFWVPVNDLMQIVKLFGLAKTDEQKQSVRDSLELLFNASIIAKINYETRVSGSKPADELINIPIRSNPEAQ
jgi:hypothetical protein